jgi:hypothetical protein
MHSKSSLSVPEQHQLNVMNKTMAMNCTFAVICGVGHGTAAQIIHNLTGRRVAAVEDCRCPKPSDAFRPISR